MGTQTNEYPFSEGLIIPTKLEPLTNDHPHQRPSPLYDHTNVILRVVV